MFSYRIELTRSSQPNFKIASASALLTTQLIGFAWLTAATYGQSPLPSTKPGGDTSFARNTSQDENDNAPVTIQFLDRANSLIDLVPLAGPTKMVKSILADLNKRRITNKDRLSRLLFVEGKFELRSRHFDQAMTYFKRACAVRPFTDSDEFLKFGTCCYELGDFADSEKYYKLALAKNPNNSDVMLGLARTKGREGNLPEALRCLDRVIHTANKETQEYADALREQAAMFVAEGRTTEAVASLDASNKIPGQKQMTIVDIASKAIRFANNPVQVYSTLMDTEEIETKPMLKKINEQLLTVKAPNAKAALLVQRAQLEIGDSHYEAALSDAALAIGLNDTYRARGLKAAALIALHRTDDARLERRKAVRLFALAAKQHIDITPAQ